MVSTILIALFLLTIFVVFCFTIICVCMSDTETFKIIDEKIAKKIGKEK